MQCALQHGQPVQGSAPQQFFIMLLCVVVVVDAVSLDVVFNMVKICGICVSVAILSMLCWR